METIPNCAKVEFVRYHPTFSAICPVGDKPFWGEIDIEYHPRTLLLEYISVDNWLKRLGTMVVEDVARLIFDEVTRVLGDIPLRVVVHARTTVHAPVSAQISRR